MSFISRKILPLCALVALWVISSGFTGLNVEMAAGIESVMDDLTSEDFEEIQAQDEWSGKVLANVEDYSPVRKQRQ